MEIEEGKIYKLRNGVVTDLIKKQENNTNYLFTASVQEPYYETPTIMWWLKSGHFLSDNIENRYDIIEEA